MALKFLKRMLEETFQWLGDVGLQILRICQTIFKNPEEISLVEPVKEGHGEGGFVVISAQKEART